MQSYENTSAQQKALSVMPVERLKKNARNKFEATKVRDKTVPDDLLSDILLREMKEWFKTDFFSWNVCPNCAGARGWSRKGGGLQLCSMWGGGVEVSQVLQ